MFKPKTYIDRRTQLCEKVETGVILLLGNDESSMNYLDNTYPFRQDSSFLYYIGIDQPYLAAVIDVNEGRTILFGDDLTIDMIVWMGKQPTLVDRAQSYGITEVKAFSELQHYIRKVNQQNRPIHFLPTYRPENRLKLFDLLGIHPSHVDRKCSEQLIKAIVSQREIKSEEEIAEIEKAVDTTAQMHIAAMQMIEPGITEAKIAAEVERIALAANGRVSFPVIATINGQTLHNHYHGNTLKKGDLFLLDAGAETASHYAGDMSSTIPVDTSFNSLQKHIYNIALKAHNAAINALAPGVKFRDVHFKACETIFDELKLMGLTKGDTHEAVTAGAHALFFPCGTGHMMGLDVHDMEDLGEKWVGYDGEEKSKVFGWKSLRLAKALKPGFVLTIEPGVYFIPELIDMWHSEKRFEQYLNYTEIEKYRNFGGCRNEEDFLITNRGYRLLGEPIPKEIDDVEAIRNRPRLSEIQIEQDANTECATN